MYEYVLWRGQLGLTFFENKFLGVLEIFFTVICEKYYKIEIKYFLVDIKFFLFF